MHAKLMKAGNYVPNAKLATGWSTTDASPTCSVTPPPHAGIAQQLTSSPITIANNASQQIRSALSAVQLTEANVWIVWRGMHWKMEDVHLVPEAVRSVFLQRIVLSASPTISKCCTGMAQVPGSARSVMKHVLSAGRLRSNASFVPAATISTVGSARDKVKWLSSSNSKAESTTYWAESWNSRNNSLKWCSGTHLSLA